MNVGGITTIARSFVRRRFRNKASTAMLLAVPIVVAFVFGLADQRANTSLAVGLVQAPGAPAAAFARALHDADALRVRTYSSVDEMRRAIERGDVVAGIEIPSGYDPSVPVVSSTAARVYGKPSESAFVAVRADVMLIAARQSALARAGGQPTTAPIEVERVTAHTNSNASGLGRATAGMLVFFMFDSCIFMGAIFAGERERGCVSRMSTTPNTRVTIVAGEVAGRAVICVIQAIVVVLAGRLLFGVHWGNPVGVLLVVTMFALVGTSASILVGCRENGTQEQVASSYAGVVGVLGLLGGCFWSLAVVPGWLRSLGHVSPLAWANDGFDKLLATDAGIAQLWLPLVVMAAFTTVLFVLAVTSLRGALRR